MILGGKLDFNSDMQKTARSASFPQTKISTGGSRVSEQGYVAVDRTKNHSPWICPSVIYYQLFRIIFFFLFYWMLQFFWSIKFHNQNVRVIIKFYLKPKMNNRRKLQVINLNAIFQMSHSIDNVSSVGHLKFPYHCLWVEDKISKVFFFT